MRILVAEDEVVTVELYAAVLEERGHKVIVTYDGRQCLNTYRSTSKPFDGARDRCRELPAVELLAELVGIDDPCIFGLPVGAVGGLVHRDGDETLPLLARRLGDQLLDPQPEPAGNRADLHLVAPVLPSRRETLAELEAGVALVEPAGLDHLLDAK